MSKKEVDDDEEDEPPVAPQPPAGAQLQKKEAKEGAAQQPPATGSSPNGKKDKDSWYVDGIKGHQNLLLLFSYRFSVVLITDFSCFFSAAFSTWLWWKPWGNLHLFGDDELGAGRFLLFLVGYSAGDNEEEWNPENRKIHGFWAINQTKSGVIR